MAEHPLADSIEYKGPEVAVAARLEASLAIRMRSNPPMNIERVRVNGNRGSSDGAAYREDYRPKLALGTVARPGVFQQATSTALTTNLPSSSSVAFNAAIALPARLSSVAVFRGPPPIGVDLADSRDNVVES